jgi:predicted site-specific integrase-resolvase
LLSYKTPGGHRRYLEADIQKLLALNKPSPKAAFYTRVSTKKQEDNLNRQVERLRQYCKEKGEFCYANLIEIAVLLRRNNLYQNKFLRSNTGVSVAFAKENSARLYGKRGGRKKLKEELAI